MLLPLPFQLHFFDLSPKSRWCVCFSHVFIYNVFVRGSLKSHTTCCSRETERLLPVLNVKIREVIWDWMGVANLLVTFYMHCFFCVTSVKGLQLCFWMCKYLRYIPIWHILQCHISIQNNALSSDVYLQIWMRGWVKYQHCLLFATALRVHTAKAPGDLACVCCNNNLSPRSSNQVKFPFLSHV